MPRNAQVVNLAAKRKMIIRWMIVRVEAEENTNHIGAQAVDKFPDVFRQMYRRSTVDTTSTNMKMHIQTLWQSADSIIDSRILTATQ